MWYLLIWFTSTTPVVIPEQFANEEVCMVAGKSVGIQTGRQYKCISIPANQIYSNLPQYDKDGNLKVSPGYYCGQYPDKCKIDVPKYDNCTYTETLKICSK